MLQFHLISLTEKTDKEVRMRDYEDYEGSCSQTEPRTLRDFDIDSDAVCGVCGQKNSIQHPLRWVCCVCDAPTHIECGYDCEPTCNDSYGSTDPNDISDTNYWLCRNCLEEINKKIEEREKIEAELRKH